MAESRTPKQIAAADLGLEMLRLEGKLVQFGAFYTDVKVREAGHVVGALYDRVRVHMHPRDREESGQ